MHKDGCTPGSSAVWSYRSSPTFLPSLLPSLTGRWWRSKHFGNVSKPLQNYTAVQPNRQAFSYSAPRQPQIMLNACACRLWMKLCFLNKPIVSTIDVHSWNERTSRQLGGRWLLPAHNLVGQQHAAHLWVFVLALVHDGLVTERICSLLDLAGCFSGSSSSMFVTHGSIIHKYEFKRRWEVTGKWLSDTASILPLSHLFVS
jgi:hypothetical protein